MTQTHDNKMELLFTQAIVTTKHNKEQLFNCSQN